MAATGFVRARIDESLKNEAAAVLDEMGLTVSDVVRMVLTRVARDRALPFELRLPNSETRSAMVEARDKMARADGGFPAAENLFVALEQETGDR